jgi:UDPglucose 6-dehydrogenase
MYAAANQAEALIILTDWPEFRNVDFARLASVMSSKIIVDGRNLYPLDTFQNLDFTYISMGRPAIVPKS